MSKKNMIIIISVVLVIFVLILVFRKNSKPEKIESNNEIKEQASVLEIDGLNTEPIESIYYVDPDYNPRFPDEE